eukprot:COSAG06_NODE_55368_length_290_cov_0.204188_1_plen_47_part_10
MYTPPQHPHTRQGRTKKTPPHHIHDPRIPLFFKQKTAYEMESRDWSS